MVVPHLIQKYGEFILAQKHGFSSLFWQREQLGRNPGTWTSSKCYDLHTFSAEMVVSNCLRTFAANLDDFEISKWWSKQIIKIMKAIEFKSLKAFLALN